MSSQNLKPVSDAVRKRESRSNASEGIHQSKTMKAESNNNPLAQHYNSVEREDKKESEIEAVVSDSNSPEKKEENQEQDLVIGQDDAKSDQASKKDTKVGKIPDLGFKEKLEITVEASDNNSNEGDVSSNEDFETISPVKTIG